MLTVEAAAELLAGGEIVGIPTETVYGLGAHGLDPVALGNVYAAKGRPRTHPLILHVLGGEEHAVFDDRARALVARFWPGPLTLVLPRRPHVPDALTGGHPTVALRSPSHPVTRELLVRCGFPLAAPSANRFGGVSPTTADHVRADFPGIPVLDGGPCAVGLESTIVDLIGEAALLRPGGVPVEAVEAVIGRLLRGGSTPAPGTLPAHYAPRAFVVPTVDPEAEAARLSERYRVGIARSDPAHLYADLRRLDAEGVEVIVVGWAPEAGIGIAVNDRLRRAAWGRSPDGNS